MTCAEHLVRQSGESKIWIGAIREKRNSKLFGRSGRLRSAHVNMHCRSLLSHRLKGSKRAFISLSTPVMHSIAYACIRVPSDPTDTKPLAQGASDKAKAPAAYDQQQPDTPSMIDAIRRYDFVKRALEE